MNVLSLRKWCYSKCIAFYNLSPSLLECRIVGQRVYLMPPVAPLVPIWTVNMVKRTVLVLHLKPHRCWIRRALNNKLWLHWYNALSGKANIIFTACVGKMDINTDLRISYIYYRWWSSPLSYVDNVDICFILFIWILLDLTNGKSTLVQIMAWCHQATGH